MNLNYKYCKTDTLRLSRLASRASMSAPHWKTSLAPRQRNLYGKGVTPPKVRERKAKKTANVVRSVIGVHEEEEDPELLQAISATRARFQVKTPEDALRKTQSIKTKGQQPKDPMRHTYKLVALSPRKDEEESDRPATCSSSSSSSSSRNNGQGGIKARLQTAPSQIRLEDSMTDVQRWDQLKKSKYSKLPKSVGGFRMDASQILSVEEDVRIRSRAANAVCKDIRRRRSASKSKWLVSDLRTTAEQRAAQALERELWERNIISSLVPSDFTFDLGSKSWIKPCMSSEEKEMQRQQSRQALLETRPRSMEYYLRHLQAKYQ